MVYGFFISALPMAGAFLIFIFLSVFFFCVGWSFFYEFIPVTWIEEYGMTSSEIGIFFAYGAGFYALSCGLLIRPVVKRFRSIPILFYTTLFMGLYMLILLCVSEKFWLWAYLPLLQFFAALFFPTSATIVSNSVDDSIQGETLGILQSVDSFAFATSPIFSGALLGLSAQMPIIVGSISMFVATLLVGIFLKKELFKKT